MKNNQNLHIDLNGFGTPEVMFTNKSEIPLPNENEYLIRIAATALNRAEIQQRLGKYPPNKNGSQVLGLECAGWIIDKNFQQQEPVMALLNGGGYSQYALVHKDHVIKLKNDFPLQKAASIMEVWLTAFQLLVVICNIKKGEKVLIYGGASGVGTAACQLVKYFGGVSIVTVGSDEKRDVCAQNGANLILNYKSQKLEEILQEIEKFTDHQGVDIVLDCVGAQNFDLTTQSLSQDGKWISYGFLGGSVIQNMDLKDLFRKRIQLLTSSLKTRTDEYKKNLIQRFNQEIVPQIYRGELKPVIDENHSITNLDWKNDPHLKFQELHKIMEKNLNKGKIVITYKF